MNAIHHLIFSPQLLQNFASGFSFAPHLQAAGDPLEALAKPLAVPA